VRSTNFELLSETVLERGRNRLFAYRKDIAQFLTLREKIVHAETNTAGSGETGETQNHASGCFVAAADGNHPSTCGTPLFNRVGDDSRTQTNTECRSSLRFRRNRNGIECDGLGPPLDRSLAEPAVQLSMCTLPGVNCSTRSNAIGAY